MDQISEPASSEMVAAGLRAIGVEPTTRPRVVACLSGGSDSTFLTWALCEIGCEVIAFHLDHGLRHGSELDARCAEAIASQLGIPIHSMTADIEIAAGSSPETAAREARYAIAEQVAGETDADWIATGHTADDQIETFFINLARGAGLDGLAAIPPRRGRILRPMLSVSREGARQACADLGMEFIDDPTNDDTSILRNRIRHDLLPRLAEILGPGYRDAMLRQFAYLRGDAELLNALADAKLKQSMVLAGGLAVGIEVNALAGLNQALARRMIRRALAGIGVETPPAGRFVEEAIKAAREGGSADLGGGFIARREGECLVVRPAALTAPEPATGSIPGRIESPSLGIAVTGEVVDAPETWEDEPGTAWIAPRKAGEFTLRTPREGERFSPLGMKGSKPLADFLAEAGMLRTAREWAPVLASEDSGSSDVAWVIGRRVSSRFAVPIGAPDAIRLRVEPLVGD